MKVFFTSPGVIGPGLAKCRLRANGDERRRVWPDQFNWILMNSPLRSLWPSSVTGICLRVSAQGIAATRRSSDESVSKDLKVVQQWSWWRPVGATGPRCLHTFMYLYVFNRQRHVDPVHSTQGDKLIVHKRCKSEDMGQCSYLLYLCVCHFVTSAAGRPSRRGQFIGNRNTSERRDSRWIRTVVLAW